MSPAAPEHGAVTGARGSAAVWVFHAGALGDFVMIWPLLRALARRGAAVTVVADGSKARQAARELGIVGVDAEQRRFARLWAGEGEGEGEVAGGVERVVTFAAAEQGGVSERWTRAAQAMFPGARVECVGPPGSAGRAAVWGTARVGELGGVPLRDNPRGAAVLHVGAGSEAKRWPLERWAGLAARLRERDGAVDVLAGEVEAERFTAAERGAFAAMGGRYVWDVIELADLLRVARVYIGADTGPTHLAAQLGVRTVALFGPTDPRVWGPVGPGVKVVAARTGKTADIAVDDVMDC